MVKHIVLWAFKDGVNRERTYAELKAGFDAFKNEVPGLHDLKLHLSFSGWDICLESLHTDAAALAAYQAFPAHVAMKEVVKATRGQRASCDFEV
jgi:hypothetical protein